MARSRRRAPVEVWVGVIRNGVRVGVRVLKSRRNARAGIRVGFGVVSGEVGKRRVSGLSQKAARLGWAGLRWSFRVYRQCGTRPDWKISRYF